VGDAETSDIGAVSKSQEDRRVSEANASRTTPDRIVRRGRDNFLKINRVLEDLTKMTRTEAHGQKR
jgi:hypothetical protein